MPELLDVKRWRFVFFAILASYGTLWFSDYLLPDTQSSLIGMYATTFIEWVVAFSVGGFVAGRRFLLPAVASTMLVVSGIILHTAYLAGQYSQPISPVLTNNLPLLVVTVAATAIGASIGMWFAAKVRRQAELA
jgi:hypothetical protein